MTDKQIIIDGVDVSRCKYYKTGDCLISPVWCDQFYNCYYKHLQRVDERNKELEDVEEFRLEELATLDNLRDENNKLKQTIVDIKAFVQKEIEYFEHDIEYQYDWKELMKLIKISEVEDE